MTTVIPRYGDVHFTLRYVDLWNLTNIYYASTCVTTLNIVVLRKSTRVSPTP